MPTPALMRLPAHGATAALSRTNLPQHEANRPEATKRTSRKGQIITREVRQEGGTSHRNGSCTGKGVLIQRLKEIAIFMSMRCCETTNNYLIIIQDKLEEDEQNEGITLINCKSNILNKARLRDVHLETWPPEVWMGHSSWN